MVRFSSAAHPLTETLEKSNTATLVKEPVVSLLMLTYNHAQYVAHALDSVLAQNFEESFEIVIGEDCSTDGTREIVDTYLARRPDVIRVVTSERNVGLGRNFRRIGLRARGSYTAFCEGDDLWHNPDKLAR